MITGLLLLSAISCVLLGSVVFFQSIETTSNQLFAGICFCFAIWAIAILVFLDTNSAETAYIAAKVFYIAAAIFPCLLLIFAYIFPVGTLSRLTRWLIVFVGVVMTAGILFYPSFVLGHIVMIEGHSKSIAIDKPTYVLYAYYFVILFAIGIAIAVTKAFRLNGKLGKQASLYAVGILINSIPGVVTNLILPYYGNYELIWIGPVASVFFLSFATYSIIRHGLFDIRLAAVRSVAYLFSLLTLSALYYFLAYIVSTTLFHGQTSSAVSVSPVNILLALILAFAFQPIKRFFDKFTNDIFYRDRYDSSDFFARLSEVLTTTTELRSLLQRAAVEIGTTLKSEQAFFFVQYNHTHRVIAGTKRHTEIPRKDVHDLNTFFADNDSEMLITELLEEHSHERRVLISHKIAILMPLMRHNGSIGYLALGDKRSGTYTPRDIKVLKTISDELIIAIQNALSVQEVRDINANLEQRVDAATAELRTSNARLRRLDASKDEFLSMASHQLRTPLTSVKGYISMVLEGDMGKVTPMQKQVLEEAFTSSERMVHLIHDFLNVSRLQTGKFMLEREEQDLSQLISEEVKSLEPVAKSHHMTLKFIDKLDHGKLNIDNNKIRQVVMNFIDNAIFYSHPDTVITVEAKTHADNVEVTVKDTGIGVPKSEQAHLFSKFYRATNARKQRPDGTGVGIFLAKKVITAHGGEIIFESKENRGSTFGFRLPIRTGAVKVVVKK